MHCARWNPTGVRGGANRSPRDTHRIGPVRAQWPRRRDRPPLRRLDLARDAIREAVLPANIPSSSRAQPQPPRWSVAIPESDLRRPLPTESRSSADSSIPVSSIGERDFGRISNRQTGVGLKISASEKVDAESLIIGNCRLSALYRGGPCTIVVSHRCHTRRRTPTPLAPIEGV